MRVGIGSTQGRPGRPVTGRGRARRRHALALLVAAVVATVAAIPSGRPAAAQVDPEPAIDNVDLAQVGFHNLASPGWDGQVKPRGQNGDVAVLSNERGRTAFVGGGALFHGVQSTQGRVCTDYGGVKIVDLDNLAAPAGIIDIADTKGVQTGPTGNPRRGLFLKNVASSVSSLDARTFTAGPAAGKDVLAIATQRCEPSFFNGARIEFWDVTDRGAPAMLGAFDPETIPNPDPTGTPANGAWGIFEEVRMFVPSTDPGKVYAVATTPFSIGNSHDASFAGDFRLLDVTNPASPVQLGTFPDEAVGQSSNNGCRTFQGGRSAAPSPDGSKALLSWYDGIQPAEAQPDITPTLMGPDPNTSAAVMLLDLAGLPDFNVGTPRPSPIPAPTPNPPSWGYPTATSGGQTAAGAVEGNAADLQPFTGPGDKLMTFVSEDDIEAGLGSFAITAPTALAGDSRGCVMSLSKKLYELPNQQLSGSVAYVGRACPASTLVNDTLPVEDPLLDNPAGRIAVIEGGGSQFNMCSTMDKIRRVTTAGATGVVLNLGGNFLGLHIAGPDGGIPSIPSMGVQLSQFDKLVAPIPGRILSGATFPTSWARTTSTNVTVNPVAMAVTAATNTTPIAITTGAHGLTNGETVVVAGVTGNTAANGNWVVNVTSATTFELVGSVGNGAFTGGGTVQRCPAANPACTATPARTDWSRFRSVANVTDPVARGNVNQANRFAVVAGQQYQAGAFLEVEAHAAGTFRAAVEWFDAGGDSLGESQIGSQGAVSPRARFTQNGVAPAGATRGAVKFEWTGAAATGTADADTFSLVPGGVQVTMKDHPGECPGLATWPPTPAQCGPGRAAWGNQRVLDFSPTTPVEVGRYRSPRSVQWPPPDNGIYMPRQARVTGDRLAFTTWMSDGLRVLDRSNPAAPREVGAFVPPDVADPSPAAGAGPTNRSGPAQLLRGQSWPDKALVTGVDVIPDGPNSGTVVVSDVNAGLYVLEYTANLVTPARYNPVTPARLLDTRFGTGAPAAKVGPGATLDLQVTGVGGVPAADVSAVVLNVTAVDPTGQSFLTAWPTGEVRPLASNLNYTAGQVVPNLVKVKVGNGGKVSLFNQAGSVHLVADVAGWYGDADDTTGDLFNPLTPARLLDTRFGTGAPAAKVGPGATLELQVTGAGGVPASGVTAAVLNLTAVDPTAQSFLTAWPTGETRPLASNLNYTAGQIVPNLAIVKVGNGGKVSLFNQSGSVHLLADVAGWYGPGGGSRFSAITPSRLLDTRFGTGAPIAKLGPGATLDLQVAGLGGVPLTGVTAVALNVTAVNPTASLSFLTAWPAGEGMPTASSLNYTAGQVVPNLVIVKLGTGGKVSLFNQSGSTDLVADLAGWYSDL